MPTQSSACCPEPRHGGRGGCSPALPGLAQVPAQDKEPFLTAELTAGQGRMASAPCLFITPLQCRENTPARASRARTCAHFRHTDACLSRTCFLSTLGGPWQRCCCSPAARVVFHPGRRQSRKAQEGHFKEFYIKAVHNRAAGAGRRQGARPARSRSSSLPTPSLQAAAIPGHRRWELPLLPPLSKGLCAVERCLGCGSEQAKSPIRHCIASHKRYQ